MDYENWSTDKLIERIRQLEEENAKLNAKQTGYIYCVFFDNLPGVYKVGKSNNVDARFQNYKSNESKQYGQMHVFRVGAVRDSLKAEQRLKALLRNKYKCCAYTLQDENGKKRANGKSDDTSEWFETEKDIVEQAFNETLDELGIDIDKVVRTFDSRCIEPKQLIEIEHYENIDILPNTYYYNPNLDVLYQRYTHGYDYIRTLKQSQRYALKTEDGINEVLVPKKYLRNY